jgi:hypothetical protein
LILVGESDLRVTDLRATGGRVEKRPAIRPHLQNTALVGSTHDRKECIHPRRKWNVPVFRKRLQPQSRRCIENLSAPVIGFPLVSDGSDDAEEVMV